MTIKLFVVTIAVVIVYDYDICYCNRSQVLTISIAL